jgi:hypothetical protein
MVKKKLDYVTRKLAEMDFYRRTGTSILTIARPSRRGERVEKLPEASRPQPQPREA